MKAEYMENLRNQVGPFQAVNQPWSDSQMDLHAALHQGIKCLVLAHVPAALQERAEPEVLTVKQTAIAQQPAHLQEAAVWHCPKPSDARAALHGAVGCSCHLSPAWLAPSVSPAQRQLQTTAHPLHRTAHKASPRMDLYSCPCSLLPLPAHSPAPTPCCLPAAAPCIFIHLSCSSLCSARASATGSLPEPALTSGSGSWRRR